MTISPQNLVDFSDQLNNDGNYLSEAAQRAIISRSYYAAYHTAQEIIQKFALPESTFPSVGSHQRNLNRLTECVPARTPDFRIVQSIGYITSRVLNPHRELADYHLSANLPSNAKDEALERVKVVLEKAKTLLL